LETLGRGGDEANSRLLGGGQLKVLAPVKTLRLRRLQTAVVLSVTLSNISISIRSILEMLKPTFYDEIVISGYPVKYEAGRILVLLCVGDKFLYINTLNRTSIDLPKSMV
jgi:hypothetical protein